jgi:hypothetical protein
MLQVYFRLAGTANESLVKILAHLPGAQDVKTLSDGELTLIVDSEDRIPVMVSALVNAGTEIKAVEPRPATLEDIYLRLQHKDEEMVP